MERESDSAIPKAKARGNKGDVSRLQKPSDGIGTQTSFVLKAATRPPMQAEIFIESKTTLVQA
jgi:hypothetical protein